MADEKCDYCKPYDGQYLCLAESKMRKFDEFAWAEDYPECDSNFYRGCPCYLYEINPQIIKMRLKQNQNEFRLRQSQNKFNLEDDFL